MPQASESLRGLMCRWFGDTVSDAGPAKFLMSRGYMFGHDYIWVPPVAYHTPSREEMACLVFLVDEWDYGYHVVRDYPETRS